MGDFNINQGLKPIVGFLQSLARTLDACSQRGGGGFDSRTVRGNDGINSSTIAPQLQQGPAQKMTVFSSSGRRYFDGKAHVEWYTTAAVTPIGQLPFFIQFLKVSGLFEHWV